MDKQIVNEEQIDGDSIIYDPSENDRLEELPDVGLLLDSVISLMTYLDIPEMKLLRETNEDLLEEHLEDKFPEFVERYYSIFKMILSGDDLTPLFEMMKVINNVNRGRRSIEDGEKRVGKYLSKFLPEDIVKLSNGQ
jgi:hypothetical protein